MPDGCARTRLNKVRTSSASTPRRRPTGPPIRPWKRLIHNLNTMHSRAGAQMPFSSINYGMDTSPEGRMVMRNVLLATEAGLGNGETPIFPIQIFRVKEGVNFNPGEPNYDLFQLAMPRQRQAPVPQLLLLWTRPSTCKYYKEGHPETEIAYMGCRTRVIGNVYDPTREICPRPRQPELHLHQPAPHRHQGQGRRGLVLRGTGPHAAIWCIDQLLERL